MSSLQDRLRAEVIDLIHQCPNSVFSSISGGAVVESVDVAYVVDTVVCAACSKAEDVLPIAARISHHGFTDLRCV